MQGREEKKKKTSGRFEENIGCLQKFWNFFDGERFKAYFRISWETFKFTLNHIEHRLEHETTAEEPIAPEVVVVVVVVA